MEGKYLNPKYARRKQRRKKLTVAAVSLTLAFCCFCAIYTVDSTARATMLPAAPPVAQLQRTEPHLYELTILGQTIRLNTGWTVQFADELRGLLATPPAPVRLWCQVRVFLSDELPRNARVNTKTPTGV